VMWLAGRTSAQAVGDARVICLALWFAYVLVMLWLQYWALHPVCLCRVHICVFDRCWAVSKDDIACRAYARKLWVTGVLSVLPCGLRM
jgi:hypothetical protein